MLSLQHLTVTRGKKVVLRDLSLDIEPKDVVCVVGEEGSGKTTLLKLLTRELSPDEGVIKIDGAIMEQLPRGVLRMYRARVGYLAEDATLDPSLTIARNVGLPLDYAGAPAAERDRAVADLLKRLRIASIAPSRPMAVSRGERQLAAFARTIAAGPLIVLLDEPFQGVGDDAARICASMLQNMRKKGATIVVATAEERTASFFENARVVRLQRGKLTENAEQERATEPAVREIALSATSGLVEKTSVPVAAPETESAGEKKKVRITPVGSL